MAAYETVLKATKDQLIKKLEKIADKSTSCAQWSKEINIKVDDSGAELFETDFCFFN